MPDKEATPHVNGYARKFISPKEFREEGYLVEVNRLVLHPLGLAMAYYPDKETIAVIDNRDDLEGFYYNVDDPEMLENVSGKIAHINEERRKREPHRILALGYWIQSNMKSKKEI